MKDFIPYEQALELKELGFNEECIMKWVWSPFNKEHYLTNEWLVTTEKIVLALTFSQAFRWFRENHNLYPIVDHYYDSNDSFLFNAVVWSKENEILYDEEGISTYEEAELVCLKKLIEIVKNK